MRKNLWSTKKVNEATQHDIKLELDVLCQALIQKRLLKAFRGSAFLGEEGVAGNGASDFRWVVDPIDGTVNFTYGIPHACVSIALQQRGVSTSHQGSISAAGSEAEFTSILGVVYDPFCDEMWTAIRGGKARLNGRAIRVSQRTKLSEAIVVLGFGKKAGVLNHMLPMLNALVHRVRKIRINGAAALALTYVASGRYDAFLEAGLRLWDIAAGGLILECAGGSFWYRATGPNHVYEINASNGPLGRTLDRYRPKNPAFS